MAGRNPFLTGLFFAALGPETRLSLHAQTLPFRFSILFLMQQKQHHSCIHFPAPFPSFSSLPISFPSSFFIVSPTISQGAILPFPRPQWKQMNAACARAFQNTPAHMNNPWIQMRLWALFCNMRDLQRWKQYAWHIEAQLIPALKYKTLFQCGDRQEIQVDRCSWKGRNQISHIGSSWHNKDAAWRDEALFFCSHMKGFDTSLTEHVCMYVQKGKKGCNFKVKYKTICYNLQRATQWLDSFYLRSYFMQRYETFQLVEVLFCMETSPICAWTS